MPKLHTEILGYIRSGIIEEGPHNYRIEEISEVGGAAENASEVEFRADDDQWYILSIIERDT